MPSCSEDVNLREGMKFIWWMSHDGTVLPEDIDPDVPREAVLSAQEEAAYQQLWKAFQDRLAGGEIRKEYKGDSS